jgi:hypothetical protein
MGAPATPLRAHHRLLKEILSSSFSDAKVNPTPDDLNLVSRVFQRAGGSWIRVYGGSVRDVTLLKKTLKVAVQKGYLTKASNWGG